MCQVKLFQGVTAAFLHAGIQRVLPEGGPNLTFFFLIFNFLYIVDDGRDDPHTT